MKIEKTPCQHCGRPVVMRGNIPHVELLGHGARLRLVGEDSDGTSIGLFPVGPNCGRKLARTYYIEHVAVEDMQ